MSDFISFEELFNNFKELNSKFYKKSLIFECENKNIKVKFDSLKKIWYINIDRKKGIMYSDKELISFIKGNVIKCIEIGEYIFGSSGELIFNGEIIRIGMGKKSAKK